MNNLRGAKIIYQESKATQPSHLYFLQKDANYCEAIVTSESGAKRKLNFNVDLSNFYTKTETYSKIEIDNLLDTIEVTKTELDVLISENKLEPNRLYKITGVESWCFSQHLIKAIYLKAITNNTLESEGVGEFYIPKYNDSESNLGIWKGELLANGMIDSLSYNIGDKVIWGNLFWENVSGSIGNNIGSKVGSLVQVKVENHLSETDWQLITPNNNENLYNIQFDRIKYDIENDYINFRADDFGNVYELSYNTLFSLFPLVNSVNVYYINGISLFQWGISNTSSNTINESLVFNCNHNLISFKNNHILKKSTIIRNSFLNVNIEGNTLKKSYVTNNFLKTYGGIFYNNLDNSYISLNKYYFEISNNRLNNNSQISSNNDNNIIVNNKYTIIRDNILDNNCKINSNTFVEKGKEIDDTIKSIHGNELRDNCTISNNTIKNGSRIFGHKLEYYSTINGNTLDTEANIYNNQLIQNGKIDNNILTGHGRIYGNQLDRQSEITLCKLRISPATSYSTTMKNNRLFAGKVQNVDFGDIVNPEGTNPNDPAFGGNDLSECIIENNSIIKDLTFPNHGGVGIQFVKMNGYSEFKNITVNDSIRNVDFINTIFNETSDYSKLIEGSGHQTNGFTKTYIDGVLLQDKLDEKQDVLDYTPEDVANKSDSYTANSSTTYASTKALVDGLATKQNILTNPITGTVTVNYIPKSTGTGTVTNSIIYDNGTNVGIGTNAPNSTDIVHVFSSTTKSSIRLQSTHSTSSAEINFQSVGGSGKFELDYAGNMVFRTSQSGLFFDNFSTTGGIYFRTGGANVRMTIDKDGEIFTPSGKIKPQRTITITGNTTLSETHNGAVLNVTNTCNITIPTGLDANFQCVIFAKGSIIVTFVNSGVIIYAPSGLLLKTDKMASLISTSANNFNLTGELATT